MDEHIGCRQQVPLLSPGRRSDEMDGVLNAETPGKCLEPLPASSPVRPHQDKCGIVPCRFSRLSPAAQEQIQALLIGIEPAQIEEDAAAAEIGQSPLNKLGVKDTGHLSGVDAVRGHNETVFDAVGESAFHVQTADRMEKRRLGQVRPLEQGREGLLRGSPAVLSLYGEATVK